MQVWSTLIGQSIPNHWGIIYTWNLKDLKTEEFNLKVTRTSKLLTINFWFTWNCEGGDTDDRLWRPPFVRDPGGGNGGGSEEGLIPLTGRAPTGGGLDGRTPGLFSSQFPFVGAAAVADAVAGGRAIIDEDGSGSKWLKTDKMALHQKGLWFFSRWLQRDQ